MCGRLAVRCLSVQVYTLPARCVRVRFCLHPGCHRTGQVRLLFSPSVCLLAYMYSCIICLCVCLHLHLSSNLDFGTYLPTAEIDVGVR